MQWRIPLLKQNILKIIEIFAAEKGKKKITRQYTVKACMEILKLCQAFYREGIQQILLINTYYREVLEDETNIESIAL